MIDTSERSDDLPIKLREGQQSDFAYILKTWSVDYHKTFPVINIPNSLYFPHQKDLITKIVLKCGAIVACADDEPDLIVGYIISEPYGESSTIVHWANVKGIYRRMGIFNNMLSEAAPEKTLIATHNFHLFNNFKTKYNFIYDPYQLEKYL
jgi:hypothetical protein